jgi:hypothetical protein
VEPAQVPEATPDPRWRAASYAFALLVALGLGYFICKMPLQVSDDVSNMMKVHDLDLRGIYVSEIHPGLVYLRPMIMFVINFAFELGRAAGGRYFETFKTFHVLQVVAVLLLFVRPLKVRTAWEFAVSCLAVTAVVGMHTFFGTIYEAYPINAYMTILICCMLAVNLVDGPPTPWRQIAAVALFAFAVLTIETGVLVLVCFVVGYAVGFRGVSLRGLAACAGALAFYLALRFVLLSGHMPGLEERSSGFGFKGRDPAELIRMFGDHRLPFYLYNVASSVLTIPFAEPRAGVWRFVRALVQGSLSPPLVLYVVTSTVSSLLIASFIWRRRHAWLRRQWDHHDRLVLIALAVIVGNGVMSFPYTKDVIVSPAGLLYPLALFAAVRDLPEAAQRGIARRLTPYVLALLSLGWALRAVAVPYGLWETAYRYQHQWVHIDEWLVDQKLEYKPPQLQVIGRLRDQALRMPVPNPRDLGRLRRARWLFDRP